MEKPALFAVEILLLSSTIHSVLIASNETVDHNVLVAFKSRITSDPFQVLAKNWSSGTSICHWKGISCGRGSHPRVTALNFSGFGFGGTIPPYLGNLTFLTSLDFRSNNFSGCLPYELSSLRRLQLFDVGFNNFTGDVPSWFGNLRELRSIFLNNNRFSGSIPPSLGNNGSRLQVINLGYNLLSGNIPRELRSLTWLKFLDIKYNLITDIIPYSIFNLSSIETIDLTGNVLSGILPEDMCNNYQAKLRELHLSFNQLSGQIPFNIYKCSELQQLSLSFNHFNGSIPKSIGWMTKMQRLYLGTNDFRQGEIPMDLRNLSRLHTLDFSGASLIGKIPSFFFNISSLERIDFSNNSLSGDIPEAMPVNLYNLQQLDLHSNKLIGNIPKYLGNLTALEHLILSDNNLTGELPVELGNLNLVEIDVTINSLSGAIPSSIFNISTVNLLELGSNNFSGQLPSNTGFSLSSLQGLFLLDNQLSGVIPSSITNASKLVTISIGWNSFSGSIPNFGDLRLLRRLFIEDNNFTVESPNHELTFLSSLQNCRHLKNIALSQNQLHGMLPASIGNFSSSFSTFKAVRCGIRGSIPVEFGNLTNLNVLYLDSNKLTGFIPRTIGNLERLKSVHLEHNKLEGFLPTDLCKLSNLWHFFVSDNALQGPIPTCFGELKSLRQLFLDSNKLEFNVPSELWDLKDLLSLNLSRNMLNGSLSSRIGNLNVMSELDLSWNQLSGEVPSSIGNAESLVVLNLAHNKFQGSIPESLGDLRGMESLDLSFNDFSGFIPNSLERLIFLRSLNLSYNRLEGQIPTGGKFANFAFSSFMKNYNLCGGDRLQVQPCVENRKKTNYATLVKYIVPSSVLLSIILLTITIKLIMRRNKLRIMFPDVEISLPRSVERKSYLELVRATNQFNEDNLLGRGSFGSVFIGTLSDGMSVAIKVFDLDSEQAAKSFNTEIGLLSGIRHKNLIKILGYCSNPGFKALIMEYMPRQSLEIWLHSHNLFLDLLQRLNIAIDVAFAVQHLHLGHTFPVIHCDLKPSNVLLDEDMTAHVSDFGIAKLFGEDELMTRTTTLATIGYMAPEYGAQGIVSMGCDIYSFGIILLELCTAKSPTDEMFEGNVSLESWVSISLRENKISEVVDMNLFEDLNNLQGKEQCLSSLLHLAMECLAISPAARINISMVVAKLEMVRAVYMETMVSSQARRELNIPR